MSTLQTTFLKHPDAAGNQVTFASDGTTSLSGDTSISGNNTVTGNVSAVDGTLGGNLAVTGDAQMASLNSGQLAGRRNRIETEVLRSLNVSHRGTTPPTLMGVLALQTCGL